MRIKLLTLVVLFLAVASIFAQLSVNGASNDWKQWSEELWKIAQSYDETDEYTYWEIYDEHEVFHRDFESGLTPRAAWRKEKLHSIREGRNG